VAYYKHKTKRNGLWLTGIILIGGSLAVNQFFYKKSDKVEKGKNLNPAFTYLEDEIQKLKSLNPDQDYLIALSLARKLRQKADYLQSADYYEVALRGPWTDTQRYNLELEHTDILRKLGNQAEAEAILNRLQQQNPEKAEAFNKDGLLKESTDSLDHAERKFQQAVKAEPTAANSYKNLARVLKKQKKTEANEVLKIAIKQTKNNPEAYLQLIESLAAENKINEAEQILQDAKNQFTHKPSDLLIMESILEHYKGNHGEAEKKLSDALHLSPKNKKAKHYLAREQLLQKNDDALKSYQAAIELDPANQELIDEYNDAFDTLNSNPQIAPDTTSHKFDSSTTTNEAIETDELISSDQGENTLTPDSNESLKDLSEPKSQTGSVLNQNSEPKEDYSDEESPNSQARSEQKEQQNNEPRDEQIKTTDNLAALQKEAEKQFLAGKYNNAKRIFESIYNQDKSWTGIHYFLGRSNHMLKLQSKAIAQYDLAKKESDFSARSHYYCGRLYLESNNYKQAISNIEEAIKLEPLKTSWLQSLAVAYEKDNKPQKALRTYAQSLAKNPNQPTLLLQKGLLERKTGAYKKATESFQKVLSQDPLNKDAWLYSGENYIDLKMFNDAQSSFRNLLAIEPNHFNGNYNLLFSFLVKNDLSNGLLYFTSLPEDLKKNEKFLYLGGNIAEKQRNYKKAVEFYEASVSKKPRFYQAWLNLGNCLKKQESFEKAGLAFEKAKSIKPKNVEPKKNLALLYEKEEKWDKAREEWLSLIMLKPGNFEFRLAYAKNLETGGLFRAAQKQYESILKQRTSQPQAMERLGFLYYRKLDEPQEALETFLHLLKNHPTHPRKKEIRKIIEYLKQG
jgi:tetratricopeptide (TPR) repeat protein